MLRFRRNLIWDCNLQLAIASRKREPPTHNSNKNRTGNLSPNRTGNASLIPRINEIAAPMLHANVVLEISRPFEIPKTTEIIAPMPLAGKLFGFSQTTFRLTNPGRVLAKLVYFPGTAFNQHPFRI